MNAPADHGASWPNRGQSGGNERSNRRENNCRVQFFRRAILRSASPDRARLFGETLRLFVAAPGEGVDAAALMPRDLRNDVRRRAESVDAQSPGVSRARQRAVADQSGAQQRRRGCVLIGFWNRNAITLVGNSEFGVTAVDRVAGEARPRA